MKCPVCGSVHHPELAKIPEEAITEEAFKKLKEKENKLQEKKSDANTKAESARIALQEYEEQLRVDILDCLESKLLVIGTPYEKLDDLLPVIPFSADLI